MKIKDLIWISTILIFTLLISIPMTRVYFEYATQEAPYFMGFIKTGVLATMGELLVSRFKTGNYFRVKGVIYKFIVWGVLGMVFVLVFKLFSSGVMSAQESNLLPYISTPLILSKVLTAFMMSIAMNLFFAPAFMMMHRITDGYIDLGEGSFTKIKKVKLGTVIEQIDFNHFISFVVLKTIPLFWIPAHTITFLLPENYRVLMASYLSIALGVILTLAKKNKQKLI